MRFRGATAALGLAGVLLAPPAGAGDERRFWLAVGGGAVFDTLIWTAPASWEEYGETAELDADYEAGAGPVVEAAGGVRFTERLGLRAAFAWSRRDVTATIQARIPQPLYFGRFRESSGETAGLEYRQWSSHLDLEWRPLAGTWEVAVFAGPALVRAETDLAERVEVEDEYPFETVELGSAVTRSVRSDAEIGWSVGAAVSRHLGSRLGLGLQARYTRAGLTLPLENGTETSLEAGGLQLTAVLQVRF